MYFDLSYLQAIVYVFLEILPFAMIVGLVIVFFFLCVEIMWLSPFNRK